VVAGVNAVKDLVIGAAPASRHCSRFSVCRAEAAAASAKRYVPGVAVRRPQDDGYRDDLARGCVGALAVVAGVVDAA
jgi:hypothetical protein